MDNYKPKGMTEGMVIADALEKIYGECPDDDINMCCSIAEYRSLISRLRSGKYISNTGDMELADRLLRIGISYLSLDLEATSRENDYLKKILKNQPDE